MHNKFYFKECRRLSVMLLALTLSPFLSQAQSDSPINSLPTVADVEAQFVREGDAQYVIEVSNITPGDEMDQKASIVVTSNSKLIRNLTIDQTSNGVGYIRYRTVPNVTGRAIVEITVTDNAPSPASITKTFVINVEPKTKKNTQPRIQASDPGPLQVSPNPNPGVAKISFSTEKDERQAVVELFDLNGIKIDRLFTGSTEAGKTYYTSLEQGNLSAGTYLIGLTTSEKREYTPVIIAR
ncbi:MAG TPA: T9SS type A sorting domain-containing protein [Flavitalea sp.]|nr:T9SS type A sorting domain-containing protein [Flavitalea sp.]